MTGDDLMRALRACYDPRLRRNIVDLGMVRRATLEHDETAPGAGVSGMPARYIARVHLTASGTDETATAMLRAQIENRLAGLFAISGVVVTFEPPLFPIL